MIHRRWMNLFFSAAAIELQKSINRLVVNYLKGICKAIKLEIRLGIWSRLIFDYVNFSERNSKLPVSIKQTHIHPLTRTAADTHTHKWHVPSTVNLLANLILLTCTHLVVVLNFLELTFWFAFYALCTRSFSYVARGLFPPFFRFSLAHTLCVASCVWFNRNINAKV